MDIYYVVRLRGVNDTSEAWLSENAFSYGALGISEVLQFDQPEGEEDVFTRIPDSRCVDIYFEAAPPADFVDQIQARFPAVSLDVAGEQNKDWLEEWKKGFKPFCLVGEHWVVPSWCPPPSEARQPIRIDPGMAFGTGTHETTQLMAEALSEVIKISGAWVPGSALDVGTGTGILAILARQMGIARIQATEIEAEARRVAGENFCRNGCAEIVLDERQVQDLSGERFDIVMANIIDGVLVRLREDLLARVRPGGWLILSGVISERQTEFLAGFTLPPGKTWDLHRQKGDWHMYAVRL